MILFFQKNLFFFQKMLLNVISKKMLLQLQLQFFSYI